MALALFDLDQTLLAGDSDFLWGEFLSEVKAVDAQAYQTQNKYFFDQYKLGRLDIGEYLAFTLAVLKKYPPQQLDIWHQQFMVAKIQPILLPKAQAVVDFHKAQNDTVVVITATNDFITKPIIKAYGIEHLIATKVEKNAEGYTGKVKGVPCFQAGKITNLKSWLADKSLSLKGSYFYSDSHNDLPLLELVDNPIAVNADAQLSAIAQAKNWGWQNWR